MTLTDEQRQQQEQRLEQLLERERALIAVELSGQVHHAHPEAILWHFTNYDGGPSDDRPRSMALAVRLAAAERTVYTNANGWYWTQQPDPAFPGATRLHLYELDQHRGCTPTRYDWTRELERASIAWLALEALDPRAALRFG